MHALVEPYMHQSNQKNGRGEQDAEVAARTPRGAGEGPPEPDQGPLPEAGQPRGPGKYRCTTELIYTDVTLKYEHIPGNSPCD